MLRFCPVCSNCLRLSYVGALNLVCRKCGYTDELNPKSSEEALILETHFGTSGTAEQSMFNEYTKRDPTLPVLKTITCPNTVCPSRADEALRAVKVIRTDAKNLKFQYCCTVCDTQWAS
jgi:DNA-directed RNA polymerase subunit M/transcription elongation factor TFIIS